MGNVLNPSSNVDPDHSFYWWDTNGGCGGASFFRYPQNQQFQRRVTESEWLVVCEEFESSVGRAYKMMFVPFGLMFAAIIASIAGYSIALLSWIAMFPLAFYLAVSAQSKGQIFIQQMNQALFLRRGVRLTYYPGSKHSKARIFVQMAYPATFEEANKLPISSHYGAKFSGCESSSTETQNMYNEKFQESNAAFARSPLAMATGPMSPGGPPPSALQGAVVGGNCIQVQVPPNGYPGSQMQIYHNGMPMTITLPPNAQPGQIISVSVPAASYVPAGSVPHVPTAVAVAPMQMEQSTPGAQYGSQQPQQYGAQPQYGFQQPQYGAQPQYGSQQPQYGSQQPQYGAQPQQYGAQPQYGHVNTEDPHLQQKW